MTDRPHEVTALWDEDAGTWHHRCDVCGASTFGEAPALPCPGPQEVER